MSHVNKIMVQDDKIKDATICIIYLHLPDNTRKFRSFFPTHENIMIDEILLSDVMKCKFEEI